MLGELALFAVTFVVALIFRPNSNLMFLRRLASRRSDSSVLLVATITLLSLKIKFRNLFPILAFSIIV